MPTPLQISNAKRFIDILKRADKVLEGDWDYLKLESEGYIPLSIDVLIREPGKIRLAMAHNGQLNGDNMADPDMEFTIYLQDIPFMEAHTYQNDWMGAYRSVEAGTARQGELDDFMSMWLGNIIEQGHK